MIADITNGRCIDLAGSGTKARMEHEKEPETFSRRQFMVYNLVMAETPVETAEEVVLAGCEDGSLLEQRLTWAEWLAEREQQSA